MGSGGGNRYTITRTVGANGIKSSKYGSALDNGKGFVTWCTSKISTNIRDTTKFNTN